MSADAIASQGHKRVFDGVVRRLEALGYKDDLLTQQYQFPDWFQLGQPNRVVAAAAFARTPQSYDSACFAVLLPNGKSGAELVADYRALGAPFAFEIKEDSVAFWAVGRDIARMRCESTFKLDELDRVFSDHDLDWSRNNVLRIKNVGILLGPQQGEFDLGLIPALEGEIQRKLDLLLREVLLEAKSPAVDPQDLFRLVFRFLAAKVLHDRGHSPFSSLSDFSDADSVLRLVEAFYKEAPKSIADSRTRRIVAQGLWKRVDFRNLSVEVLAYIYENTLVDETSRRKFGTHSTPYSVARYIVHRVPFDRITKNERLIIEPCSGHGIFLVASLHRLRDLLPNDSDATERHSYFVKRLRGYEIDSFAAEVSKLCLMLADFPNHNGWQLHNEDVFRSNQFSNDLGKAGVVLCNPPFGDFDEKDQAQYRPSTVHKPLELMSRVLDTIPPAAMLGFVLPQVFLDGTSYRNIRERLAKRFDEIETVGLPDRIFKISKQTSSLLIAKTPRRQDRPIVSVTYTHVDDKDRERFLAAYGFTRRDSEAKSPDAARESLKVVALRDIWTRLERSPKLSAVAAAIHRGVEWKQPFDQERYISTVSKQGFQNGFHEVKGIQCFQPPSSAFLCTNPEYHRGNAWDLPWQLPKVLFNASRISRGQWCMSAFEDRRGFIASQNFHAVWPKGDWTAKTLAAVLNGPIANAFVAARESEQQRSRINVIRDIPIPQLGPKDIDAIDSLVDRYVSLVHDASSHRFRAGSIGPVLSLMSSQDLSLFANPDADLLKRAREGLLEIDATILKAYGLAPRMERTLLDFFREPRTPRPVPFPFSEYFPESFVPTIPLWMYISPAYKHCSAEFFLKNAPSITDPGLIEALKEVE